MRRVIKEETINPKQLFINLEVIINHNYDEVDSKFTVIYQGDKDVPVIYVNATEKDKCSGDENLIIALDYPSRHIIIVRNINLERQYDFKIRIKMEKLYRLNEYLGRIDQYLSKMMKQEISCINKTIKTRKTTSSVL